MKLCVRPVGSNDVSPSQASGVLVDLCDSVVNDYQQRPRHLELTEAKRRLFDAHLYHPLHHLYLRKSHSRLHRRSNSLIALLDLTCRDSRVQAAAFPIWTHCQMMD